MQDLPRLDRNSATGIDIRRLQGLLIAAGHPLPNSITQDGDLDGEFGDETEKALKKETGMTSTGPREWKHLLGV